MSGSGREALPDVWQCLGGLPRILAVVRMPSQMTRSGGLVFQSSRGGWEALPDACEWSGFPSGCPEVV